MSENQQSDYALSLPNWIVKSVGAGFEKGVRLPELSYLPMGFEFKRQLAK
ncbi:hypothetical protein SAMN05216456_1435 [Devosia crocina]|uniref:Uncharacterized protein n=1 Tax=Devosia crocina TaxID=429728 RepID=A0A1I7NAP1_9HYPH|nr:hypothetical protein [Devosia crocina]SFV31718.1 hypothetical protein SAMN05216456_1435 [Devosia crocina]